MKQAPHFNTQPQSDHYMQWFVKHCMEDFVEEQDKYLCSGIHYL